MTKSIGMWKRTTVQHPSIITAIFLLGYFVTVTVTVAANRTWQQPGTSDALTSIGTVLWMAGLAVILVRVMNTRARRERISLEQEIHRLQQEKESVRLEAMKETVRTLEHEVNNPLAIIYLNIWAAKRKSAGNHPMLAHIAQVEDSAKRINSVLMGMGSMTAYTTSDSPVGALVDLSHAARFYEMTGERGEHSIAEA